LWTWASCVSSLDVSFSICKSKSLENTSLKFFAVHTVILWSMWRTSECKLWVKISMNPKWGQRSSDEGVPVEGKSFGRHQGWVRISVNKE
jgi:hypothetical protein